MQRIKARIHGLLAKAWKASRIPAIINRVANNLEGRGLFVLGFICRYLPILVLLGIALFGMGYRLINASSGLDVAVVVLAFVLLVLNLLLVFLNKQ